jgi:hypothetical protein
MRRQSETIDIKAIMVITGSDLPGPKLSQNGSEKNPRYAVFPIIPKAIKTLSALN